MDKPVYYLKVEEDITNLSSGRLNVHTGRYSALLEPSPDLNALGCPDHTYVPATTWCAMHLKGNPVRNEGVKLE